MRKKPIKYTADRPMVVSIHLHKKWDIHPIEDHHTEIGDRLKENDGGKPLIEKIVKEWKDRKGVGDGPEFIKDPTHIPILVREGEFVKFVCEQKLAFKIWVESDRNVGANIDAPRNPFGWSEPQSVVKGGSVTAAVIMPAVDEFGNPTQAGPKDQGFYKYSADVTLESGEIVHVDPDGYCDR